MEQVSERQMAYLAELDRQVGELYTPQLESLRTEQKKEIIIDFVNKIIRKLLKKTKKNAEKIAAYNRELNIVKEMTDDKVVERVFIASLLQTPGFKLHVSKIAEKLLKESPQK